MMIESQKEKYRNIIRHAAASLDPTDFGATEKMYNRVRDANENFLLRNASYVTRPQADSLRRLLEDVIADHRFQSSTLPRREPVRRPDQARRPARKPTRALRRKSSGVSGVVSIFFGAVLALAVMSSASYAYLGYRGPYVQISSIDFRERPGVETENDRLTWWDAPWPWATLPVLISLDRKQTRTNAVRKEGDLYTIVADDPQLVYNTADFAVSGQDAAYLGFDFSCVEQVSEPRIEVFWWGDVQAGPEPQPKARFIARNGRMMAPLAASPSWVSLATIRGIRIDLEPGSACAAIKLGNVGLYSLE